MAETNDIPDDQVRRLINDTGIFERVERIPRPAPRTPAFTAGILDPTEYKFNAFVYTIPFTALFIMMDILVHQQFNQYPTMESISKRLVSVVPFLGLFIYHTNKRASKRYMQVMLFVLAIMAGCYLIWLVNKRPSYIVMRRCPPLGVLWVYAVVQLELIPATLSLVIVAVFFRYAGEGKWKL